MVSRTAAEDAVRRVVSGPERGDLLFFIGEQTDDQLSQWRILDKDGDSAIVAFVRRKAQGAPTVGVAPAKTVTIVQPAVNDEEKGRIQEITFKNQGDFESCLLRMGASGLTLLEDLLAGVVKTKILTEMRDLVDGEDYFVVFHGNQHLPVRMRQKATHLGQRRALEACQAVFRDVHGEDASCAVEPTLRVLEDPEGRVETELDGAILCDSQAFVVSHKTYCEGPRKVKDVVKQAEMISERSSDPAYSHTKYTRFNGKVVVPAFVAEVVAPQSVESVRRTCKENNVRLYMRNGSSISPWASLRPPQRAAAPAMLRRAV